MSNPIHSKPTHSATDLSAIRDLKISRDKMTPETIRAVSRELESLFLQEMMKTMRKANTHFESGFLHSDSGDFYQEMHDKQIALNLSQGKGVGLAEVIYRQLSQQVDVKKDK